MKKIIQYFMQQPDISLTQILRALIYTPLLAYHLFIFYDIFSSVSPLVLSGICAYFIGLCLVAIIYFVFVFPYVYALHKLLFNYHLLNFSTTLLTAFCLTLFWVCLFTLEFPPDFQSMFYGSVITQTFALSYWTLLIFFSKVTLFK